MVIWGIRSPKSMVNWGIWYFIFKLPMQTVSPFTMKKTSPFHQFSLFGLITLLSLYLSQVFAIGGLLQTSAMNEEQKITFLIQYIEKSNVIFIRNGSEYNATDAAKHLRMKREKAGKKIKTAREFIDYLASKSSVSGEPYKIKFPNGVIMPVRDVLYHELKKLESGKFGFKPKLYNKPITAVSLAC